MSSLSVNDRILQYKGISYQISQIVSKKVVHIERERKIKYTSLRPLMFTIPISLILFAIAFGIGGGEGLMSGFIALILTVYSVYILKKRWEQSRLEKTEHLYGLSLRLSNNDAPLFISPSRKDIEKVNQAVSDAMNDTKSASIQMDNVNIEITDADNVTVGSVIA